MLGPVADVMRLSADEARRVAVAGQLLAAAGPLGVADVVAHLGWLQIDPTAVVERTERLVLFSRLGAYDVAELDRLLAARELFEYRAFILPSADFALHRPTMQRYPDTTRRRGAYVSDWLVENGAFRDAILQRLQEDGALPTSAFADTAVSPWTTGGWNDGKNVAMMLEMLWAQGVVTISARDGRERIWDLAERILPITPTPPPDEVARRLVDRQLAAFGVARPGELTGIFEARPPGAAEALAELVEQGRAVPVVIDGLRGTWYAHIAALEAPFHPRTTVLSPFDRLIHDRRRATQLFRFDYKLEIYVPPARREYGYYVLPVLDGDRLVGRIDPLYDRADRTLLIKGRWIEPGAPAGSDEAIDRAIADLAAWLGAGRVATAS